MIDRSDHAAFWRNVTDFGTLDQERVELSGVA